MVKTNGFGLGFGTAEKWSHLYLLFEELLTERIIHIFPYVSHSTAELVVECVRTWRNEGLTQFFYFGINFPGYQDPHKDLLSPYIEDVLEQNLPSIIRSHFFSGSLTGVPNLMASMSDPSCAAWVEKFFNSLAGAREGLMYEAVLDITDRSF